MTTELFSYTFPSLFIEHSIYSYCIYLYLHIEHFVFVHNNIWTLPLEDKKNAVLCLTPLFTGGVNRGIQIRRSAQI